MNKLLIVDDEREIRKLIRSYAVLNNYDVSEAENGQQAVEMCEKTHFDIIIRDIMMPVMNGLDATAQIREFSDVPVIFLTAKNEEYDRIKGFSIGADDYVAKPFSLKELMLRLDAVLRRTKGENREIIEYPGLKIDKLAHRVYVDGNVVNMTPKEYEILVYMAENNGIAISREKFINKLWSFDYDGFDRTLDTHIKLLRKNLGEYASYIQTVRGVGYRFEA